jgi:hypothetical protein
MDDNNHSKTLQKQQKVKTGEGDLALVVTYINDIESNSSCKTFY